MRQVVRILTDSEDGFLYGKRYLIHDRDPLYRTAGFHETLKSSGIEPGEASCPKSRFELLRGTLCQICQIGVFGSFDSVFGEAA
jgi:hypothetical protein